MVETEEEEEQQQQQNDFNNFPVIQFGSFFEDHHILTIGTLE